MQIKVWSSFSKRRNSTKQPPAPATTTLTASLKEETSMESPTFLIAGNVEYTYVEAMGNYYFVSDIVHTSDGTSELRCTMDDMATHKTDIGNTVARIAFASTGYDKDIIDPRIAVHTTKIKYDRSVSTAMTELGCYIFTVFNDKTTYSNGVASAYAVPVSTMSVIKGNLANPTIWASLQQFFDGRTLDSIFGCVWVPFDAADIGSSLTDIYIGDETMGVQGYEFNSSIKHFTQLSLEIPYRYNDFRDAGPYTTAQIYLPGVGDIDINMNDWLDTVYMKIDMYLDCFTGELQYYLSDVSGNLIQTVSCSVGSPAPLGQASLNAGGTIAGLSSGLGAAATIGATAMISGAGAVPVAGAIGLITTGAGIAMSANQRSTSLKGSSGGRVTSVKRDIVFTGFYMDTEDCTNANYIAEKGRPVNATHAINTHSGFVQCEGASIALSGFSGDRDRINSMLNSGFFYE